MYNMGYRFEAAGKSVVVSGDTSFDERLVDLARGADMLVMDGDERWGGRPEHKMAPVEALEPRYRPGREYGGDFTVRPHATLEEIAAMAAAAGVKHLVLTHFRAGAVDEEAVRASCARAASRAGDVGCRTGWRSRYERRPCWLVSRLVQGARRPGGGIRWW